MFMTVKDAKDYSTYWGIEVIKSVGFPIVVASLLMWVWFEATKEDRIRMIEQERFIRDTLTLKLDESTKVMEKIEAEMRHNTISKNNLAHTIDRLNDSLRDSNK